LLFPSVMRLTTAAIPLLLAIVASPATLVAQSRATSPPRASGPRPARYQVPAGSALLLKLRRPVDSSTAAVNDQVEAELWSPVIQDGVELIPEGSVAVGVVRGVVRASKASPAGSITLAFMTIEHAETRSRAAIATRDLVVTAPLAEPPRGRFKRRSTPLDVTIKAGASLVAVTSEPLVVWLTR
jgi:hypothetical protein